MIKENLVFTAVGQGGGNIVRELELNDCQTFYVNTSIEDLESLETNPDKWYHIENTKGMAKDIEHGREVIQSDYNDEKIAEKIYKKYANSSIYTLVFTSSGGTGSSMSPYIARAIKEMYPDKIVNAITVLPHSEEDMIMQYNAIECLKELQLLVEEGVITSLIILDNNKKDYDKKLEINKEFASIIDKVLSFNSDSIDGNLDEEEIERLFSTPGVMTIHELDNADFVDSLTKVDDKSIFAKNSKSVKTHGLILNEEQNNATSINLIRETFGMPMVTHPTTWDEDFNIVISTGIDFEKEKDNIVIKQLKKTYNELKERKKRIEENLKKQIEENEDISVDFDDMKNVHRTGRSVSATERTGRTRGRRKDLGVKGESRFRR